MQRSGNGRTIFMAGGGTGGHVIPALAVARELQRRGHNPVFVGTRSGFEAKLVQASGFSLELIEIGGLKRVGLRQTIRTLLQLPGGLFRVLRLFQRFRPSAVFSMGGYVAGPVVLAALARRIPVVVMEPNAMPGLTNRQIGRFVSRALLSFAEASRFFPKGKTEITGLPVRREFFEIGDKARTGVLTVLITGGSRGSRTLNEAARGAWSFFKESAIPVRIVHQTGTDAYDRIAAEFAKTGLEGEVLAFIQDMPAVFAEADLIVCRSGAGAVAELGAAGKPAILVPFPYAADDHQLKNAEAFARAGAAVLVLDKEMNGRRLFDEVEALASAPERLESMGRQARAFAHPHAAERAAEVLEQLSYGNL
ncbi:MAG: undecaprenyldiphospho-muramoylpentapeptide beta-N-acetylglucosaminyltransferase [Acidobacteriaceae bacterium]|nr:undecaprenyldiphospho-muramoylpentapeptide beta-N-acetylglucosaminyltransferase [Acidobacteriaceae bacterium]